MKSRFFSYLPAAALSLLIFFTVDWVPLVLKALAEHFGNNFYNIVYLVPALAVFYALYAVLRSREHVRIRLALLLALSVVVVLSLLNLKYGVEKIHYIEYGFLSVLGFRAFSRDFRGVTAAVLSVLLAYAIGLADEFIQHFSPRRVAEFADVALNVKAGLFGVMFMLIFRKPSRLNISFNRKDALGFLAGLFLSVTGAFFFIEHVHGYGFLIRDSGGYAFYSSLDSAHLVLMNDSLKARHVAAPGHRAIYDDEAKRHEFQRNFYLNNKFYYDRDRYYIEYGKSYRENTILERYYGYYVDSAGIRWDNTTRGLVSIRQWPDTAWHSRVKETMIVSVSRRKVRALFISLLLILSAAALMAGRTAYEDVLK